MTEEGQCTWRLRSSMGVLGAIVVILIAVGTTLAVASYRASRLLRFAAQNSLVCTPSADMCHPRPRRLPRGSDAQFDLDRARYLLDLVLRTDLATADAEAYDPPQGLRMFLQFRDGADGKVIGHGLACLAEPHEVFIAFRGTHYAAEWIQDFTCRTVPFRAHRAVPIGLERDALCPPGVMVHQGFETLTNSMMPTLLQGLDTYANDSGAARPLRITLAGHSMGAAMAVLLGTRLRMRGFDVASTYTFASPRVGNTGFARLVDSLGLRVYRIANTADVVPQTPLAVMPRTTASVDTYQHVGIPISFVQNWDSYAWNHMLPIYVYALQHASEELQGKSLLI